MSENQAGSNQKVDEKTAPVGVEPKAKDEYGGIVGPDSKYVKLISSDKHEFVIKRDHALLSPTIRNMLNGPVLSDEKDESYVTFREIPSHVLHKVCEYLAYKARYSSCTTEIPTFPVPPELAFELLMASNFLEC